MQTKSTGHILSATILFALFLVLAFAQVAHAETLWDTLDETGSNIWAQQTFGNQATGVVWYNGSSTGYADTLSVKMKTQLFDDIPVRLKIYDVTGEIDQANPSQDAPVVATSDYVYVDQSAVSPDSWEIYSLYFGNTQFSLGRAYLFAFYISEADWNIGVDLAVKLASPSYDSTWYLNEYADNDYTDILTSTTTYAGTENWALAGRLEGNAVVEGEYLLTLSPCLTDTRDNVQTKCVKDFEEIVPFSWLVNTTLPNRKVEVTIRGLDDELVDSVAYYYTEPTRETATTSFVLVSTSTEVVVSIQTCLLPADEFAVFTPSNCTTQIFGNGTSTESYIDWFCARNPLLPACNNGTFATTSKGQQIYEEMECDEIGILDVKKGAQCALLWAFEPSDVSLQKFSNASRLVTNAYPIGYFTFIYSDLKTALQSTSTDVFTREVEIGKYFGRPGAGTTTFSITGTEIYVEKVKPITDFINTFLWIGFASWFILWAVTRKL